MASYRNYDVKTRLIEDNRVNIINNNEINNDDFKLSINDILTNKNNIKGTKLAITISYIENMNEDNDNNIDNNKKMIINNNSFIKNDNDNNN